MTSTDGEHPNPDRPNDGEQPVREAFSVLRNQQPPAEVLKGLLTLLEAKSPDLLGSILYIDETGQQLRHAAAPSLPIRFVEAINCVSIGPTAGSCGTAAFYGKPVHVGDTQTDPLWAAFQETAAEHGLAACWSNPIKGSNGQILGTLAVYRREPGLPSADHLRVMENATELASAVFVQHRATSQARLRDHAFASSSHGIVIVDATLPDLPIVYCNRAFERLTGYLQSEVLGRNCRFLQGTDRDQPEFSAIRNAIRNGTEVTTRLRNYRRDGTMFWCELHISPVRDADGRVTHYLGFQTDVTKQHEIQAALRESEERFRRLLEQAPFGIFVTAPDGTCTYINETYSRVTGLSPEEAAGREWFIALYPDDYQRVLEEWTRARETGQPFRSEFRFLHADGDVVWVQAVVEQQWTEDGEVHSYIGTVQNISARRQTEAEIARLQDELADADRVNIIAEMAAGISHQLNQPLTVMTGLAEVCADRIRDLLSPDDELVRLLTQIHGLGMEAGQIVRGLHQFVEHHPRKPEETDICRLISSTLELLHFELRRTQITPSLRLPGNIPDLWIDPIQIRQVLMNILKFEMNTIAKCDTNEGELIVSAETESDALTISVIQTFCQLPETERRNLFEPYVSQSNRTTSLGLSIAASIIRAHQGQIEAQNLDTGGMMIQIRLPVLRDALATESAP